MSHPIKTIFGPRKTIDTWLQNLRDGYYQQGRNSLRALGSTGYGYCCLGVLVEQQTPNDKSLCASVPTNEWLAVQGIRFKGIDFGMKDNGPIDSYSGETFRWPVVWHEGDWHAVTNLNDGYTSFKGSKSQYHRLSFKQIADLIEQHVEYTD